MFNKTLQTFYTHLYSMIREFENFLRLQTQKNLKMPAPLYKKKKLQNITFLTKCLMFNQILLHQESRI